MSITSIVKTAEDRRPTHRKRFNVGFSNDFCTRRKHYDNIIVFVGCYENVTTVPETTLQKSREERNREYVRLEQCVSELSDWKKARFTQSSGVVYANVFRPAPPECAATDGCETRAFGFEPSTRTITPLLLRVRPRNGT